MADVQQRVQALIDDLVARDVERGLQVAAYLDGELVVDAWSGLADAASGRPVDGTTLFTVFSCSKGITATVIHLLAERGLVDYEAPIAHYWPEFGQRGKAGVTVRQALNHTAGLPQMPAGIGPAELGDWDLVCRLLAEEAPLWEPGTRSGYHAYTYGWLLGEVAQRADGRPFAQIVHDEIARPLGLTDDLFFGIPDAVEARVATLELAPPPPEAPPATELQALAIPPHLTPGPVHNRPEVRRAVMPGAGGIMTARALARHYAALADADPDGIRLLTPERRRIATATQTHELDIVGNAVRRRALGYALGEPLSPMSNRPTVFGHSGAGGSMGFADPDHRFAFALTKTRLVTPLPGEGSAHLVAREVRAALGIPEGDEA